MTKKPTRCKGNRPTKKGKLKNEKSDKLRRPRGKAEFFVRRVFETENYFVGR
jgi:hypothetical protein